MATTFAQAKNGLVEITAAILKAREHLLQVQELAKVPFNALEGMPAKYATLIADIDAAAPADAVLQNLKAEKDKLVAEFTALRAKATQMKDATAAVTF